MYQMLMTIGYRGLFCYQQCVKIWNMYYFSFMKYSRICHLKELEKSDLGEVTNYANRV